MTNSEDYINLFFITFKKMKDLTDSKGKSYFNNTEMRLISEVIINKEEGKRLISTQLAKALGVTRSAVSQMVNKLEAKGIVKRVPSEYDRKIAYIELTDDAQNHYDEQKSGLSGKLGRIIDMMGQDEMDEFVRLMRKFLECEQAVDREAAAAAEEGKKEE